jgi:hypothetical protein
MVAMEKFDLIKIDHPCDFAPEDAAFYRVAGLDQQEDEYIIKRSSHSRLYLLSRTNQSLILDSSVFNSASFQREVYDPPIFVNKSVVLHICIELNFVFPRKKIDYAIEVNEGVIANGEILDEIFNHEIDRRSVYRAVELDWTEPVWKKIFW